MIQRHALAVPGSFLAIAVAAGVTQAQVTLSADNQFASRYMWRGITRSETWVSQPAVQGSWRFVSAGAWANWQIQAAWPDEISDLAPRHRGFSEVDLWAEFEWHDELAEAAVGVVRYIYPGSTGPALRTHANDTTEAYARLRFPRFPWLKPSLSAWADVPNVRGAYLEASALKGLPLFPLLLETNLDVGATVGFSVGDARRGFTHLELTLGPSVRAGPFRIAVDAHTQLGFDSLARQVARPPAQTQRTAFVWFTLTAGYTWERRH